MLSWKRLNLPVTPSTTLFEDRIVYQMKDIAGGLAHKSEDHTERGYQGAKSSERIYCELPKFSTVSNLTIKKTMT